MIKVRYLPQYKPNPDREEITGYIVWAYIGHPCFGQIESSKTTVKTKREAQKMAAKMRKEYNKQEVEKCT